MRGFEKAQSTFRPGLPFIAVEHGLGRSLSLIQFVRRQDTTALLVDACPTVREPRRQGPCKMIDELVGLGPRAWPPPLAIGGRGADGAVVENRGLPACPQTGERLLGIRFTGKRGAAPRLEDSDVLVTLHAPLLLDRALGRRLAMVRGEEDPALRYPALTRGHDCIALPIGPRGHGRRLRLGSDLLRLGQGRGDPRDPREAGRGQLVQILSVIAHLPPRSKESEAS